MVDDLICIIGPDGSGKSTQCELLQEEFERRGIEYEYRWFRFRHYLTLPLMAIARLTGLSEAKQLENGDVVGYHYYWRSPTLSFTYPRLFFLDMLVGYVLSIWPTLKFDSKVILADRYIFDTLVNVAISIGDSEFHQSNLARWFLKLVPSQTTAILLLADPEVLRDRRGDVEHDDTIEQKVGQYRRMADHLDLAVVDASKSIDEIQQEINDYVFTKSDYK